jgi:excisionase family DNA binding protein
MDDVVRIGAAAQALGVSVDTLRRWEREGRVVFERRGNNRYLKADELAALLRARGASDRSSARNRLHGVVLEVNRRGRRRPRPEARGPRNGRRQGDDRHGRAAVASAPASGARAGGGSFS